MRLTRPPIAFVPLLLVILAGVAHAQPGPLQIVRDTEFIEVGGDIGLFNLMGWGLLGAHVTRNHTSWLAGEVALHGSPRNEDVGAPRYAVLVANARVQGRVSPDRLAFATLGAARGFGLSYRYSPVVGVGVQSVVKSGSVGWRVDLQRFSRGQDLYGGGRLMVGLIVAP